MLSPHKYVDNMVQNYMTMFGTNTKLNKSGRAPLEQGHHPDIETSELLDN